MLYTIVAVLVIILDQWVKYWVAGNLSVGVGIKEFIPGIISLVNVHNDGAAFSFLSGSGARIYFIIICGVFTVGVIIALATNLISGPIGRWSSVFVVAGGLSNCIDRILYGYVQDMFRLDFWPSFAVFNVADIFITVFCFVFILYVLFGGEKDRGYDDDDDQYDEDDEESDAKPLLSRRRADDDERDVNRRSAPAARSPRSDGRAEARPDSRKGSSPRPQRKTRYEEEYEQYKAARAARQQAQAQQGYPQEAPVQRPVQKMDPADPFAEWERANARVEAQKSAYAAAAVGQRPAPRTEAPSQQVYAQPRQPAQTQPRPAAAQPRPAASAYRPAAQTPVYSQPAQQKPSSSSEDDFSLDDILNEFK